MSLPPVPPRSAPVMDGHVFTQVWSGWFRALWNVVNPGQTFNITLAKVTTGGANGSITVVNGIVTAYVAPT